MKILADDEITALLVTMKDNWHFAIYYTSLFCGLRRGEVLGIEMKNINFENHFIDIVKQVQRRKTTDNHLYLAPLKNSKPRRIFPSESVMDVINEYLLFREDLKQKTSDEWTETDLLFTNDKGGLLDPDAVYKAFKRIIKNAGIKDVRLHDLRHTYATISLASGADVKTLQEDLGHYDPGFTLKQYGHATTQMRQSARDKIDKYIKNLDKEKQNSTQ